MNFKESRFLRSTAFLNLAILTGVSSPCFCLLHTLLARLSRELSESETKFARFATRAPIGLALLAPDGLALSANDLWRDLTHLEVGSQRVSWDRVLVEGETDPVNEAWNRMIEERKPITLQTRIYKP